MTPFQFGKQAASAGLASPGALTSAPLMSPAKPTMPQPIAAAPAPPKPMAPPMGGPSMLGHMASAMRPPAPGGGGGLMSGLGGVAKGIGQGMLGAAGVAPMLGKSLGGAVGNSLSRPGGSPASSGMQLGR